MIKEFSTITRESFVAVVVVAVTVTVVVCYCCAKEFGPRSVCECLMRDDLPVIIILKSIANETSTNI